MVNELKKDFQALFHRDDASEFFAPGRINLIGEHTDYNGGYVFPCAITIGTYALAAKRDDRIVRVASKNFEQSGIVAFSLDDLSKKEGDDWVAYVKGVLYHLEQAGYTLPTGLDILFFGNIPNGSGLSSSASFELLIGKVSKALYNLAISPLDLVKLGKTVENEYIGVNSGIMDQFAIGMGKKDCAIRLDCNTLDYTYVPVVLGDYRIVIMNTNKRRELADSKYNERFAETRIALKEAQSVRDIQTLADLTNEDFEAIKGVFSTDLILKRARHAVSENQRTIEASEKLRQGDLLGFGELMKQSHLSTQHDYEVTGIELDTLVHTAWAQEGVIGARMTGAGFGGCAIALVHKDYIEKVTAAIEEAYVSKIGYKPSFYIAQIGDGAFSEYID
ncbi:galactokinase [Carnobacteriaceae bacterium zg-C25]|nr:galactokinase [Carnobacteriaceae bacterium zg-C25]